MLRLVGWEMEIIRIFHGVLVECDYLKVSEVDCESGYLYMPLPNIIMKVHGSFWNIIRVGVIWTYVNLRLSALYMDQHKSLTMWRLYAPSSNPSIWTNLGVFGRVI